MMRLHYRYRGKLCIFRTRKRLHLMEEIEMAAHKTSLTLSEVSALEARIYDIVRGDQDE